MSVALRLGSIRHTAYALVLAGSLVHAAAQDVPSSCQRRR